MKYTHANIHMKGGLRKASGFALTELLLALAVVGAVATAGFLVYKSTSSDTATDNQINGVVDFIGKSREQFGSSSQWANFSTANVVKLNRVPSQFTIDATAGSEVLYDAHKTAVTLTAAATAGTAQFSTASQPECSKLGQRVSDLADTLQAGPAGTLQTVKSPSQAFDITKLATGCSGASPVIKVTMQ